MTTVCKAMPKAYLPTYMRETVIDEANKKYGKSFRFHSHGILHGNRPLHIYRLKDQASDRSVLAVLRLIPGEAGQRYAIGPYEILEELCCRAKGYNADADQLLSEVNLRIYEHGVLRFDFWGSNERYDYQIHAVEVGDGGQKVLHGNEQRLLEMVVETLKPSEVEVQVYPIKMMVEPFGMEVWNGWKMCGAREAVRMGDSKAHRAVLMSAKYYVGAIHPAALAEVDEAAAELMRKGDQLRILDVMGGDGSFLAACLDKYQEAQGILLDLNTQKARQNLSRFGKRATCISFDFREYEAEKTMSPLIDEAARATFRAREFSCEDVKKASRGFRNYPERAAAFHKVLQTKTWIRDVLPKDFFPNIVVTLGAFDHRVLSSDTVLMRIMEISRTVLFEGFWILSGLNNAWFNKQLFEMAGLKVLKMSIPSNIIGSAVPKQMYVVEK